MLHGGRTDMSDILQWLLDRSGQDVTDVRLHRLGFTEGDDDGESEDASRFEVRRVVWAEAGVDGFRNTRF